MKLLKLFLLCYLLILLYSCSSNHYHDGRYKAEVMEANSFLTHTEILTVKGNEILDEKYTFMGTPDEKIKVSCVQYPDRIEYKEANGVTKLLMVQPDGSLKLSEYVVFSKLATGDSGIPERIKEKPLVKQEGNKYVVLDNSKGEKKNIPQDNRNDYSNDLKSEETKNEYILREIFPRDYSIAHDGDTLIRNDTLQGHTVLYHTYVIHKFYYKKGSVAKLLVIIASDMYDENGKLDCHACYPILSLGTFVENGNDWDLNKSDLHFKGSTGTWGSAPKILFKNEGGVYLFQMESSFTFNGETEVYIDKYNADTFEKISSTTSNI